MNLEISYLYRDAANYKQFQSVIVANPDQFSPETVSEQLRSRFAADQVWPDILHFRPEDLGWPTCYFENHGEDEDDLDLHELESISPTDQPATTDFALNSL
ncbi:MAG: hypothetical protein P1U64_00335 [Alcanivoracaceae bacterium]|nr:hypothetical protein [Alcanivoracaceae bacterium]